MEKIEYKRGIIVEKDKTESGKIEIDKSRVGKVTFEKGKFQFEGEDIYIDARDGGDFTGNAIYLTGYLDWVLCKDKNASLCLIPLKKVNKQKWLK